MNSRNKFLKTGLIILSTFLLQRSFAQTFKYDQGTAPVGNFKFTTPVTPLDSLNPNQTNPLPFYTFFMEIGNGRYIKDETHIHNEFTTQQKVISYNYFIPANSTALLNLVGHYDTIRPPKLKMVYTASNINGSPLLAQQYLNTGKYIGLNHSLNSVFPTVVKNDMMTTVITYRPDMPAKNGSPITGDCIVAIFYNKTDLGGTVFDILSPLKTYKMIFNDGSGDVSQAVKAIRKHAEESGIYDNIDNIPLSGQSTDIVKGALATAKDTYQNALYFTIPANASVEEKNIFLSMLPVNSPSTGNLTGFKTYIIKYTSTGIINQQAETAVFQFNEYASDPNGISTFPACLDSFPGPYTDKPVRYTIDFQNDGESKTQNAKVTVLLPEGIPFPSSGSLDIIAKVKQQDLVFEKYKVSTEMTRNTYQFVTTTIHQGGVVITNRSIVFRMPGIQLAGTNEQPANERLRHGRISFTLHTSQDKTQIPECMYSDISIVFYSTTEGMQKENRPIRDHALTRRTCSHTRTLPACSRLTVYPRQQN